MNKYVLRAFENGWRPQLEAFLTDGPHSLGPQTTKLLILDVHRTALNRDGSLHRRMIDYAGERIAEGYELLFLSYDPNDKRMSRNYRVLNRCELYRGRKKVFIKKRKKYAVIHTIDRLLAPGAWLIFIDDNHNNVDNIDRRLLQSTLTTYYSVP
jgi:hypothetical protein